MHDDARRYWAWLLSGVILDMALAAALLRTTAALAPSLFQDAANWPWLMVPPGTALTLVHLVLLPILVWPTRGLTARDLGAAFALAAIVPLATLFGAMLGISFGLNTFLFVGGLLTGGAGRLIRLLPTWIRSDTVGVSFMLACAGLGFFTGGAVCCTLIALVGAKLRRPGQVAIRVHTAALGGGIAGVIIAGAVMLIGARAVVLGGPGLFGVNPPLLHPGAVTLLRAAAPVVLAGVPHLLLTCRDLARSSSALANWPVAARRLLMLLAALGATSELLAKVIRV